MTFTAATQAADANPAKLFMESLDTRLLAAGFEFVEEWPLAATLPHVRAYQNFSFTVGYMTGFGHPVDGVTLVEGDRVLLAAQTVAAGNGVWVAHAGAWTRDTSFDATGDLYPDLYVYVDEGGVYSDYLFRVASVTPEPWVPDTSTNAWSSAAKLAVSARHRIYRSPAAGNSQGADWFLTIARTSDNATSVSFAVSELYDPVTHLARNYAPTSASAPAAGSFAVNDSGRSVSVAAPTVAVRTVNLSAAGFQNWVSASGNRLIVTTRIGTTNSAVYAGLYDDALPATISPFPLIVAQFDTTNTLGTGLGRATREPNTTTNIVNVFGINIYQPVAPGSWDPAAIYFTSLIPARPTVYSSRVTATPGSASLSGIGFRGFLKDVLYLIITGAVAGDTMTVTDNLGAVTTHTAMGTQASGQFWVDQGV